MYLDLVHVHNSFGGPLGAQTVADALIQSHAVELAVVRRPPPERAGNGNIATNVRQRSESSGTVKHSVLI